MTVLFGGVDASGYLSDTWEWDGVDWTQRTPASAPSARAVHAMAYDSARGMTVLYGGHPSYLQDTWEWDGVNWQQRSPSTVPSGRQAHAMAYDSARGVTVLFGGLDGNGELGDTWEWAGVDWTQRTQDPAPLARRGHAMAYDSTQGVTVLFGGQYEDPSQNLLDDTWEYGWLLPKPVLSAISNPDGDGEYLVDWSGVAGATVYHLEEDHNPGFSTPMPLYGGPDTEYQINGQQAGSWYYRVRASNDAGDYGPWSNVEAAHVKPEAPLLAPISNPDGNGGYLVDWNDVTGATTYQLQEDDDAGFSSPDLRYTGPASQYQVDNQQSGIWYYRVRATNAGGASPWSNTESVVADGTPPASTATAPTYANAQSIPIDWTASDPDPFSSGLYQVCLWYKVDTTGDWTVAPGCQPGSSGTFDFDPPDGTNGIYYFQTIAEDNAGNVEPGPSDNGDDSTIL